jgi:hypothetical protein
MITHLRKFLVINVALILALLGGGVLLPAIQGQAASDLPDMVVTLMSRGSAYTTTVDFGSEFTFQARVQNTGNLPLEIVTNLDVPQGWDVNERNDDCPDSLDISGTCTFTWQFTPHVSGSFYLRVYTRGLYTDSSGNNSRITRSPAFLLNVRSSGQTQPQASSGSSTVSSSNAGTTTYAIPSMYVSLITNDLYTYAATVYAEKSLIFRARVKNTGNVPLQVVANLNVPQDWDVDQNSYSDCPDSLEVKDTCTISWYFTPQGSGQVYLRVYVRGIYDTSSGGTNRITQSPAFIFNVRPPKS